MSGRSAASQPIFSVKIALIAVLVAAISFASVVVLSAFAPELRDRRVAGLHAYSTSALGYNFATRLLTDLGYDVVISRDIANLTTSTREGLLILTPSSGYDDDELEEVNFDRLGEPSLIVLPKRNGASDLLNPRFYGETHFNVVETTSDILRVFSSEITLAQVPALDAVALRGKSLPVVFSETMQVMNGSGIEPILTSEAGVLLGRISNTQIYILAEPELMNTHGLAHQENAEALVRIMSDFAGKSGVGTIVFDTTLHGFERSRDLLRLIFEPPILGATLFGFATMILLGWAAFMRFGKPMEEAAIAATGRQSLVESTAGLFRQTNREPALASNYAGLARRLIIRELGYPDDLSVEQMDRILAERAARVRAKHPNAPAWPDPAKVSTHNQLMHFVKDFHVWKREMSDERQ